jgi:hypothetical protein
MLIIFLILIKWRPSDLVGEKSLADLIYNVKGIRDSNRLNLES